MELFPIHHINPLEVFPSLRDIPDPPLVMTARGSLDKIDRTLMIALSLPEHPTDYGIAVCEKIIRELSPFPLVVISPLHPVILEACMSFGNKVIAISNSVRWESIDEKLARRFLVSGGILVSPEDSQQSAAQLTGMLSDIAIVIEAKENEKELLIAKAANRYKKMVCAVPGPVTSETSLGSNKMLTLGAIPVTCAKDIISEFMYLNCIQKQSISLNEQEVMILDALEAPKTKADLSRELGLTDWHINILCSTLVTKGLIKEEQGELRLV